MLSDVVLVGRITKTPEVIVSESNVSYTRFYIADNRSYINGKKIYFHPCIAYKQVAEDISRRFKKGDLLIVKGELQTSLRELDDKRKINESIVCVHMTKLLSRPKKDDEDEFIIEHEFNKLQEAITPDESL